MRTHLVAETVVLPEPVENPVAFMARIYGFA